MSKKKPIPNTPDLLTGSRSSSLLSLPPPPPPPSSPPVFLLYLYILFRSTAKQYVVETRRDEKRNEREREKEHEIG